MILPFFISLFYFIFIQSELENLTTRIALLEKRSERKEAQMKHEEKLLHQITHSHLRYLEDILGSMVFLATERQKWQLFSKQIEPSHPMKERVSFLEKNSNKLEFVQSEVRKNALFQETEEKQKNPVEMNEEDLKTLLCYIEGAQIHPNSPKEGAPQLLFKSFELEKKTVPGIMEKTYLIQMQLIKREALAKS